MAWLVLSQLGKQRKERVAVWQRIGVRIRKWWRNWRLRAKQSFSVRPKTRLRSRYKKEGASAIPAPVVGKSLPLTFKHALVLTDREIGRAHV